MSDGVGDVFLASSVSEIAQFCIEAVAISMQAFLALWRRAKEGLGNQQMDVDFVALPSEPDMDAQIAIGSGICAVHPKRLRLKLPAFLSDDPRETSHPTERGNLVAGEVGDFSPNLIAVVVNRIYAMGSHLDLRERLAWLGLEPVLTHRFGPFFIPQESRKTKANPMDNLLLSRLLFIALVAVVMILICHGCKP